MDFLSRSLSVGVRTDRDLVDAVYPGEQTPRRLEPRKGEAAVAPRAIVDAVIEERLLEQTVGE